MIIGARFVTSAETKPVRFPDSAFSRMITVLPASTETVEVQSATEFHVMVPSANRNTGAVGYVGASSVASVSFS